MGREYVMKKLETRLEKHVDSLLHRYPRLKIAQYDIIEAYLIMENTYQHDGKILVAGNGGSAADSEHIAGELMKRFKIPRPVDEFFAEKLKKVDMERGAELANHLESIYQ